MRVMWIVLDALIAALYQQVCVRRRRYYRWLDRLQAWVWNKRWKAAHR